MPLAPKMPTRIEDLYEDMPKLEKALAKAPLVYFGSYFNDQGESSCSICGSVPYNVCPIANISGKIIHIPPTLPHREKLRPVFLSTQNGTDHYDHSRTYVWFHFCRGTQQWYAKLETDKRSASNQLLSVDMLYFLLGSSSCEDFSLS